MNTQEKIYSFINDDSNKELINKYDSINNNIPLKYNVNDIADLYDTLYKTNKSLSLKKLFSKAIKTSIQNNYSIIEGFNSVILSKSINEKNSIQRYFNDINDIYIKNNNNYDIKYCPENRNKLIEMNLKAVISIAKRYRGLGLDLDDLISAGNLGLVIAYDKFDPKRSTLKDNVIECINNIPMDELTYNELLNNMSVFLTYGNLKKKFNKRFKQGKSYSKKSIVRWVNSNIYNAKFNSIATMWIRAYILIEINNNSRLVKKPKSEIYKDKELYGSYQKENNVNIDRPVNDDSNISISDVMSIEDDKQSDIDIEEGYTIFKDGLNKLLDGVKTRDRKIFLKKFGIGLPRPMSPREIAEYEGLSIARISQVFQNVLSQMQKNQVKYNIDPTILFNAVEKMQ